MQFKSIYIFGFFTLLSMFAYAQETQASKIGIKGEINFNYSHLIGGKGVGLGGFSQDFMNIVPAMGRFQHDRTQVNLRHPSYNIGVAGNVQIPIYDNAHIRIYTSLEYGIRYSYERSDIFYARNTTIDPGTGNELDESYPTMPTQFGGPGNTDTLRVHALINQIHFGFRMEHVHSRLHAGFMIGTTFYNPLHARWTQRRQQTGSNAPADWIQSVDYEVTGRETILIGKEAGAHAQIFSLGGTSEVLLSLQGRVGYGPLYLGVTYSTNVRVNVVSFDVGFTLHTFGKRSSN
ncbi:hypothetical protein PVA45_03715 [Entomospira entomophila]|uniref:Outer membrane protein beta-barrel domain-containing protein n=1 Tax=Entomospira entomophila TaxID=2719988 RepID=A0A968KRC0_9SPIO|nr:hypothetical protein [Entomospira entomophilus]NIZ40619.1 hypothetical protein [Entomospira entomophilus]WDI34834.1 hypothetical protein PVA45_03715 [Entomospira entomophilus]